MKRERTDLYAILGLTTHATPAQLSRAYRALLRQHHPDTRTVEHGQSGVEADEALQDVLTAYAVLRDPARRADYDRLRGLTAPPGIRPNVCSRRTDPDPRPNPHMRPNPYIQAGPVHWHRYPDQ